MTETNRIEFKERLTRDLDIEKEQKSLVKSSVKIIDIIKSNPTVTIPELASAIGLSSRAIEKQMKVLRESAVIRRVGPDKGGYWEVVK